MNLHGYYYYCIVFNFDQNLFVRSEEGTSASLFPWHCGKLRFKLQLNTNSLIAMAILLSLRLSYFVGLQEEMGLATTVVSPLNKVWNTNAFFSRETVDSMPTMKCKKHLIIFSTSRPQKTDQATKFLKAHIAINKGNTIHCLLQVQVVECFHFFSILHSFKYCVSEKTHLDDFFHQRNIGRLSSPSSPRPWPPPPQTREGLQSRFQGMRSEDRQIPAE